MKVLLQHRDEEVKFHADGWRVSATGPTEKQYGLTHVFWVVNDNDLDLTQGKLSEWPPYSAKIRVSIDGQVLEDKGILRQVSASNNPDEWNIGIFISSALSTVIDYASEELKKSQEDD